MPNERTETEECTCFPCKSGCGRVGNPAHRDDCCESCRRTDGRVHTYECAYLAFDDGCQPKPLEDGMTVLNDPYAAPQRYPSRRVMSGKSDCTLCKGDGIALLTRACPACNPPAPAMQWLPIETAPKDGTVIIACHTYAGRSDLGAHPRSVRWGAFHPNAPGQMAWRNMYGHKEAHLTHWMPLPASPKENL